MNHCTIIGRLGADAELKDTRAGSVLSLRVAVNERRKQGDQWVDETTWFGVAIFGRRAEALDRLGLTKGTQVCAIGPVKARAYTARDGEARASLDMIARDLHLLGGGSRDGGSSRGVSGGGGAPPADDFGDGGFSDDQIPFAKLDERLT